jgi:hypothetical protein
MTSLTPPVADTVSDPGVAVQAATMLGRNNGPDDPRVALYRHYWPPVPPFGGFDEQMTRLIQDPAGASEAALEPLRSSADDHGAFLHLALAEIYAHLFGYRDGAFTASPDDDIEERLLTLKIRLERELLGHWLPVGDAPEFATQELAAEYLDYLAATNPGVAHPLFDYLAEEAGRHQLERFLQCEVIRNEVVDDEVALLVVGLQGMQKAVAAANLWDECGRGRLENFHTYWLRRLLQATDGWDDLSAFRPDHPWFAKITSNLNAALLTRPSRTQEAYGCFLVFESWVEPHFRKVLHGLSRVGIDDEETRIYFTAHVAVDPRHSAELADGLRRQRPRLTPDEIDAVVRGAHWAAAAGVIQFDHMLQYLRGLDTEGAR